MSTNFKKPPKQNIGIDNLMFGKVPPQNRELEEAVLGACMLERDTFDLVRDILHSEDCFYVESHKLIFRAMMDLCSKKIPVDLLTITDELRRTEKLEIVGGAYYITNLTMSVVSSAHVEAHSRIVFEMFLKREEIRISGQIIGSAYQDTADAFDVLEFAENEFAKISVRNIGKAAQSSSQLVKISLERIQELQNSTLTITGIDTGFIALNKATSGWQKTDLIIVAARPSVGKTAFSINLIVNAAKSGHPAAFFSLEMGANKVVNRILSSMAQVDLGKFTRPQGLSDISDMHSVMQAASDFAKLPVYIDDESGITPQKLRNKLRKLVKDKGIQFAIVDYLQLMKSTEKGGNREQEISSISRELKGIAKDLDMPIIALSQLSRGVEKTGGKPMLSDLRESGAIEQDADMVMFLTRDDYQKNSNEVDPALENQIKINIAKYRDGQSGEDIFMEFHKNTQTCYDNREYLALINKYRSNNASAGIGNNNTKDDLPF